MRSPVDVLTAETPYGDLWLELRSIVGPRTGTAMA